MALSACVSNPPAPSQSATPATAPSAAPGPAARALAVEPACERLPTLSNKDRTELWATVGAVTGAVIGTQFAGNHTHNAVKGALGGALVGALAASAFKNQIDVEEQADGSVRLKIPGQLMFSSGQANLSSGFQSTLSSVTSTLKKYCGITVRVVGHTDSVGTLKANQLLSEQRARAVQTFMQGQGYESGRLSFEGRGPNEPIASNADEMGRQQNRRVEIFARPPAG